MTEQTISKLTPIEVDQIKALAVEDFVNGLISAFDAGFVESPVCSLAEVHRMAQHHVELQYGVKMPHITETWGNEIATECGFNAATGKLERPACGHE